MFRWMFVVVGHCKRTVCGGVVNAPQIVMWFRMALGVVVVVVNSELSADPSE